MTDVAGELAAPSQLERMNTRYYWARDLCRGARVLELACGTGPGLGPLSRATRSLVGADYSLSNLRVAHETYGARVPLASMDAQCLAFRDGSFDAVLFLEVLYFLPDADAGLSEITRVLRRDGVLLLSVINRDTPDFAPSPLYVETYGVIELASKCREHGLQPRFFGALPVSLFNWRARALRPVKRMASRLTLIPNTMQARLWLKRLVFGALAPIPRELHDEDAHFASPVPLPDDRADRTHQLLLCAAARQ